MMYIFSTHPIASKINNNMCHNIIVYTRVNQNLNYGKKSTIAANHLKNLAGDTQNINESKINLDS